MLCIVSLCFTVCQPVLARSFRIKSYNISSLYPTSLSSGGGSVYVTVENKGKELGFSNMCGELYRFDEKIADFTVEPFSFPAACTSTEKISGHLQLAGGWNFLTLLTLASNFHLEEYSMSISLDYGQKNRTHHLHKKKVPLTKLLK